MTSKRWAFLAMTLISVISFVVDQVFMSSPSPAVANLVAVTGGETSDDAPVKTARPNKGAAKVIPAVTELADPSLTYLDKLPKLGFRRDVFAPTPEMLKYYETLEEKENTDPTAKGAKPGTPEAFEAAHKLQATYTSTSPEGAVAVVDGKMMRVGGQIGGFRLIHVDPYHAEFKRDQERAQLYIAMPDTSAPKEEDKPEPAPEPVPAAAEEILKK